MSQYESNAIKINIFGFFSMFLIIIPIIVPYFLSLGLTMEEVFITQAIFCISIAVFEVPSAYLGDLFSRKTLIIAGSFIMGIGFTMLLETKSFWGFCFYECILAVGASFVSGADLSILYDSIGDDRERKLKAIGEFQSFRLLGEALAAVCCSLLVIYGIDSVLKAQFLVGWMPFIISFFIKEPPFEKMDRDRHRDNFKEVIKHIISNDSMLKLIFINMVTWSFCTFSAIWLIQKYWSDSSISLSNLGYFWAICNLSAAVVGQFAGKFEQKFGSKLAVILIAFIPITSYITMGLIGGWLGITCALGFYISRGLNMVILKEAFNHRVPSKFRNTANSLSSLCFRLTFFILGPLIGYMVDLKGLNYTLILSAGFFVLCFIGLTVPLVKRI